MQPYVPLTRRKTLRLLAAALCSSTILEASGQQKPPSETRSPRKITVEGSDVVMQITESQAKDGSYLVQIAFLKNGSVLFQSRTRLDSNPGGDSRLRQRSNDGRGFLYDIDVHTTRNSPQPEAPPNVVVSVTVQQPDGTKEIFGGRVGIEGPEEPYKRPVGLDASLPEYLKPQLSPFRAPLNVELSKDKEQSGGKFTAEQSEQPHAWRGTACRAACWALAGVGSAAVCGGTFGIGCLIAAAGFGAAASICSDVCPTGA